MKPLFVCCSLLIVFNVFGQIGSPTLKSAASAGMGGAGVAFSDINGIFHNTASTASINKISGIVAAERHFLGSPIQTAGAGIVYPSGFGAFGLNVQYSGIDLYNTQKIGLSYGRKLFDNLSIGAQFDAINIQIKDYGSKAALTFEAGLLAQLTHDLHLGFQVFSPTNITFVDGESIPTVITAGIAYLASPKTLLLAEVEQNIDRTARFKTGVAYQFVENFALRAGVATQPTSVSFGTGLVLQNGIKIDVAASYHTYLGITPSFSVRY